MNRRFFSHPGCGKKMFRVAAPSPEYSDAESTQPLLLQPQTEPFPSILQSEEDARRIERNSMRDDGRSDGHGESYSERNI